MILVTGATGYVGGRLVPRLLEAGGSVRVLVRDPERLAGRAWLPRVEVARGDVLRPETLAPAMRGVRVAYYLVHSMGDTARFHERDVVAAARFGEAARAAGVRRIVYLGGLGDSADALSPHLRSRQDTGDRRRDPDALRAGDALDFWRVESVERPTLLRLRAEMRVPGRAWLQFETRPAGRGALLVQTAYFAPRGLAGHLYWVGLYPAHAATFSNLIRRIAHRARAIAPPAFRA